MIPSAEGDPDKDTHEVLIDHIRTVLLKLFGSNSDTEQHVYRLATNICFLIRKETLWCKVEHVSILITEMSSQNAQGAKYRVVIVTADFRTFLEACTDETKEVSMADLFTALVKEVDRKLDAELDQIKACNEREYGGCNKAQRG